MNALHLDNLFITLCSRLDPYQELKLTLACSQKRSLRVAFSATCFFLASENFGLKLFLNHDQKRGSE